MMTTTTTIIMLPYIIDSKLCNRFAVFLMARDTERHTAHMNFRDYLIPYVCPTHPVALDNDSAGSSTDMWAISQWKKQYKTQFSLTYWSRQNGCYTGADTFKFIFTTESCFFNSYIPYVLNIDQPLSHTQSHSQANLCMPCVKPI